MNNENNPQEVPQVKIVYAKEIIYSNGFSEDSNLDFNDVVSLMEQYSKSRIAELEKQNAAYREALEKIVKVHELDFFGDAVIRKEIAEQALNHKDNG